MPGTLLHAQLCAKIHALAGTHSFVPSLDADEMKLFDVQRVPQNAGNTVEMQVSC